MIRATTIIFVLVLAVSLCAQSKVELKTERWIKKCKIALNEPSDMQGFEKSEDCKDRPIFRKTAGDSIVLYTWGGSMAEDLKTFKKSVKREDFNKARYPSEVQSNGTVVVARLSRHDFIWRNDTLYLLDTFNKAASDARMVFLKEQLAGTITMAEYKLKNQLFDESLYPFEPQYKMIYFTGMFGDTRTYTFSANENFREESVELKASWTENGEKMLEINLDTHTNGRYRFASNLSTLERNNCR